MTDEAERDAAGVEVPDPAGGEPYRFRPFPARRGRYWWDQLRMAQEDGHGGLLDADIFDAFLEEVETLDGVKLADLPFSVPEVFVLANRFLARTRPGWSPWPEAATEAAPTDAST